jgi:diguanylate cyclase (GGDEF)-like protein/PAS domain S-box-containing protein
MPEIEIERLLLSQKEIINLQASNQSLRTCLDAICIEIEELIDSKGITASILTVDNSRLYLGGGPSIPREYATAIDGLEIGALVGSCGAAAYLGKPFYADDISNNPNWTNFKELAFSHHFLACWSTPILSSSGKVLGTFGMYSNQTGLPNDQIEYLVKFFSNLASLAIEKNISKTREQALISQLNSALNQMQALVKVMPDVTLIMSEDGGYVDIFGSEDDLLYKKPADLINKNLMDVLPEPLANDVLDVIKNTLRTNEIQHFEYQIEVPRGLCFIDAHVAPIENYSLTNKEKRHVIWMARDITDRKEKELEIKQLAFYDPLTNLPNRRLLMDRLEHTIKSVKRNKKIAALIFIDLDDFKLVNDSIGHSGGDMLLCQVSKKLQYTLRDSDTLSRIGGDEFVILLEGSESDRQLMINEAHRVCERIIESLEQPMSIKSKSVVISASLGITLIEGNTNTADSVLGSADNAMYKAKKMGKGKLYFQ